MCIMKKKNTIKRLTAGEYEITNSSIYISKSDYSNEWVIRDGASFGTKLTVDSYKEAKEIALEWAAEKSN